MSTNERITFKNPAGMPPTFGYTHVVEARGARTIYVSGQVPLNKDGQLIGAGDLNMQTRQVFENIKFALDAAEVGFDDVVKLTFFLTDISQMQTVREIRDQYINTVNPPASSAVEVRKLIREDIFIEIEAIAVGD
ncbi:RidA family protein [Paenibacillus sp.]|jgi:reactive intermediate/imine deaminase|uniref:RidA family protein n=1 Tax=Paenibacillus sp. TaxID=58172 RepID=UPI00281885ED|nr:RidA family protein [Paenibacillus sp.]MDR0271113.1 RidA family protein [Paenibacillus sp.]